MFGCQNILKHYSQKFKNTGRCRRVLTWDLPSHRPGLSLTRGTDGFTAEWLQSRRSSGPCARNSSGPVTFRRSPSNAPEIWRYQNSELRPAALQPAVRLRSQRKTDSHGVIKYESNLGTAAYHLHQQKNR